ncbi:MAG: WD40 repeat domain-containing protein, partial [Pseudonocardiaceae bacterium]
VQAVAWSPDGTRLLTGGTDGIIRVWDATTAELLHQLTGHTGGVHAVAWSPDGTRLLTGGTDSTVRVWDATTAELLHQLTGHTGGVQAVAWSPDGTQLLTGGTGGARVWDATTAELLHQLTGNTGWVLAVAWSPDGTRLLTGGFDGSVRVWDATSGLSVGFRIVTLPGGEIAVFDTVTDQLVRASVGAWRWFGWNVVEDGRLTRLPAESFGPLPPLHPAAQPVTGA